MKSNIVLGLGNNIDYEIEWCTRTVERLALEHAITAAETCTDRPISSVRDLLVSLLGFFRTGRGGERFVTSPSAIDDLASHFRRAVTLGGTPVRAAIAMQRLDLAPALHLVTVNEHVRSMLPRGCQFVCSNHQDTLYPHLIVQYPTGCLVKTAHGAVRSPRANRVIYVHDPDNARMAISPALGPLLADTAVFLISGFNAMRNGPMLRRRLAELDGLRPQLPTGALTCYEDAGFHDPAMRREVREAIGRCVDVFSLNEDELEAHIGHRVPVQDPGKVLQAVHQLRTMLPRPLLVVHTSEWALAFGTRAACYAAALRSGVTLATTRLRLGDNYTVSDYQHTGSLQQRAASRDFASALRALAGDQLYCVPSFEVSETSATTVGLGDAFVAGFLASLPDAGPSRPAR